MAASPCEAAIEAVLRPLRLAARDDFAQLDRIRNLESGVLVAARAALDANLPRELKSALRGVRDAFAKPLAADALRPTVESALAALAPFADPAYPEAALSESPQRLGGVGPKRAEALAKRGLKSVRDLLSSSCCVADLRDSSPAEP